MKKKKKKKQIPETQIRNSYEKHKKTSGKQQTEKMLTLNVSSNCSSTAAATAAVAADQRNQKQRMVI